MIYYGKQNITQQDIDAVVDVLKSDFLTQGPKVPQFESDLANYCNTNFAKVMSNATAALHLAYLSLGLGEGDLLWTSPITFVSTANAALYCGAEVDFIDIDPKTFNLSIDSLKNKLKIASKANKIPKIVVPVHFAGQSCEMKEIWSLSREYGFKVVEDASHALGASYLNQKVGSCAYSDVAVFSFHPVKMITTGEGGAITTNNEAIAESIELLRTHGITKDSKKYQQKSHGNWYYEQLALGFNYRLTEIQAALGISQLKRLDKFVAKRREIANFYLENLKSVYLPFQHPDANSSWHLFVIQSHERNKLYKKLLDQGFQSQVHYIPVNSQPYYDRDTLENAASFYNTCLSLPIFFDLESKDCKKIVNIINNE